MFFTRSLQDLEPGESVVVVIGHCHVFWVPPNVDDPESNSEYFCPDLIQILAPAFCQHLWREEGEGQMGLDQPPPPWLFGDGQN